jgi:hypothetical protein
VSTNFLVFADVINICKGRNGFFPKMFSMLMLRRIEICFKFLVIEWEGN